MYGAVSHKLQLVFTSQTFCINIHLVYLVKSLMSILFKDLLDVEKECRSISSVTT